MGANVAAAAAAAKAVTAGWAGQGFVGAFLAAAAMAAAASDVRSRFFFAISAAASAGGALLMYEYGDRRANWLPTTADPSLLPRCFPPSLPPSLNLPSAAAGCPAGLAQVGRTPTHRWSTAPPPPPPHPSRGCGITVALLRCRLQTILSPTKCGTNHDFSHLAVLLSLNLGVGKKTFF